MRYRFGDRVLDTDTRELLAGDRVVEVEPQVFDVLALLMANRDRVVSKEQLLDDVWGDRFVSESALTTRIKQARQAVGDSGREQGVIKTLHGRGYRFVAAVHESEGRSGSRRPADPRPSVTTIPRTHYAEGDGASIAYQTFGEGPDLVFIAGFSTNVEVQWEHPAIAAFLRRLGSFARVTVLDKRGVGLSDRMPHDDPPSLETRADDLLAVMDAVGVSTGTVLGSSEGGSLAALFAATHPDRVERLVLHGTWMTAAEVFTDSQEGLRVIDEHWGKGVVLRYLGPSLGQDQSGQAVLGRLERQAATPRAARLLLELIQRIDLEPILTAIPVPTLVLHRTSDDIVPVTQGRSIVERIPDARLVELPGTDHWIFSGDVDLLLAAVEDFITGEPAPQPINDRVLATVLFVDLVDSTAVAQRLGDAQWAAVLDEFERSTAKIIAEHRGELVKSTGDGALAMFDGPGRGVQAAGVLRSAVAPLGLTLRAGLHTAEIERRGDDIAGIGVNLASRVASAAAPGEVWVSRTVTDLVAGTGLTFVERGTHELKGFDRPWALYAVQL
jgi:pimeloyl-ACP methyl ester carboxylesterase